MKEFYVQPAVMPLEEAWPISNTKKTVRPEGV